MIYVDSPFRLPFTASVGVSEAPAHIGHALLCDREFTHSRVNLLRFSSLALPFHFLFFELQNFSLPHVSSWWDLFLLFSLSQVFYFFKGFWIPFMLCFFNLFSFTTHDFCRSISYVLYFLRFMPGLRHVSLLNLFLLSFSSLWVLTICILYHS